MVGLIVRHRVRDYDAWKPGFDEHAENRRKHGALGHRLYRTSGDPLEITAVTLFKDAASANGFIEDPSLKEVMQRAGVITDPDIRLCEEVEVVEYSPAIA